MPTLLLFQLDHGKAAGLPLSDKQCHFKKCQLSHLSIPIPAGEIEWWRNLPNSFSQLVP